MERSVELGMRRRGEDPVRRVGVDEKAFRKGRGYASIMAELDRSRVLEVVENCDGAAAEVLFGSLGPAHQGVRAVAMDMWPAFIGTAARKAPEARVVHDRFHVQQASQRRDRQRPQGREPRALEGGERLAQGTKYLFLRSPGGWTDDQREIFQMVKELNLKVAKETFALVWRFECPGKARAFFNSWRRWVGRPRIEPLTKVSEMVKRHLDGQLGYAAYPITNAATEGFNSKIQSLVSNAGGYRRFDNLRTAILFHCGQLDMCPLKTQ